MSVIEKDLFVEIIDDLKRADDYQNGLNTFFKDNDVDGYIYQPDCSISVVRLLHKMFENADSDNIISYFCYELEFGKKWKPGTIVEKDKKDINLSDASSLYDYLISNM